MEKYKLEERKANLALLYNQGADQFSREAKETKTEKQHEECKKFRKLIDREAKKRKYNNPYKLTDYFAEHKEELLKLYEKEPLKKKDSISKKFPTIYEHSKLEKLIHELLITQRLQKLGRHEIDEKHIKGEYEVWKAGNIKYFIKVEDLIYLGGKNPKLWVSQMKNLLVIIQMIQEQQFNNPNKEPRCEFMLSNYAERRGHPKDIHGKILYELKRDLYTGAYTNYTVITKEKIIHGYPNFYTLVEPRKPKDTWEIIILNLPYYEYIMEVLHGEAKQYFPINRKAIEDRYTDNRPYLFLFYMQLTKRKRSNLFTTPIKIKNLLRDMKLPEKILIRPKECFKLLKECLIYFSEHYQPVPELESFKLYNDYHKTKTLPLPISISEAFKNYEYENFKDLIKSMGLKDIRGAYISFKRPHKQTKRKLNKEENELLGRVLNWFDGQVTKIPYRDQESLIKGYILRLGYYDFKELFEIESNKYNANAVDFLTRALPDKKKAKIKIDNKSYISEISKGIFSNQ